MLQNTNHIQRKTPSADAVVKSVSFLSKEISYLTPAVSSAWLLDLAHDDTPAGRLTLANAVTDILSVKASDTEFGLIGDILLRIVRQAEFDLRQTLAKRLADLPQVPHDLLMFLACDDIAVATPILTLSELLTDEDLITVIKQRATAHRQAVAQRRSLNRAVVNTLISSHDIAATEVLLANDNVTLDKSALRLLTQTAKHVANLRAPLLKRPEIDKDFALNLYWWVSQELRSAIDTRFGVTRAMVDDALEHALNDILGNRFQTRAVTSNMLDVAAHLAENNRISSGLMITMLRRGQLAVFVALMSKSVRLEVAVIEAMLYSHSGETLALCCKALGMLKPDFASIFLLARAGRPGEHVVDPQELSRVLGFFDKLPFIQALMALEKWQENDSALHTASFDMRGFLSAVGA